MPGVKHIFSLNESSKISNSHRTVPRSFQQKAKTIQHLNANLFVQFKCYFVTNRGQFNVCVYG